MVGREDLNNGIALNSIMNSLGRILGLWQRASHLFSSKIWCFLLNGLSYVVVIVCTILMKYRSPFNIRARRRRFANCARLKFARNDALITPLLLLAGVVGCWCSRSCGCCCRRRRNAKFSKKATPPSIGEGLGAVICGLLIGWLGQRFGHGRLVVAAIIINALANIILAWQTTIPPAVLMTAFFGVDDHAVREPDTILRRLCRIISAYWRVPR